MTQELALQLLEGLAERAAVGRDAQIVACGRVDHDHAALVLVANVHEANPAVRFIEVHELAGDLFLIGFEDIGVRGVCVDDENVLASLGEIVDEAHGDERFAHPTLASAHHVNRLAHR